MVLQNCFFTHQIEHFIHSQQMNSGNVTIPTNFWNGFMETTMNLMETWEGLVHTAASKQCIKLEVLDDEWMEAMAHNLDALMEVIDMNESVITDTNLEMALQCWKPYNTDNQTECQNQNPILG